MWHALALTPFPAIVGLHAQRRRRAVDHFPYVVLIAHVANL